MQPTQIISSLALQVEEIVLMHSAAGKDSIALLDMCSKHFKRIVCVFMYVVDDLSFINKYIKYQERRYPNCTFISIPHFVLLRMLRNGELGTKPNPDIKLYNLTQIMDTICHKYNIEWSVIGFKKSDSLNRRLMLNTYPNGINTKNKRCYPLADWKNKDVLAYIERNKLIKPIKYDNAQSSDVDPKSGSWLKWCKTNYPQDFNKIISTFPHSGAILYNHEQTV